MKKKVYRAIHNTTIEVVEPKKEEKKVVKTKSTKKEEN